MRLLQASIRHHQFERIEAQPARRRAEFRRRKLRFGSSTLEILRDLIVHDRRDADRQEIVLLLIADPTCAN